MNLPDMIIDDSDEWGDDSMNPDYLRVVVNWPINGKDRSIVMIEKAAILAALEDK